MKKDIILCGVGGDGIVSVAKIISDAALNLGMNVKQSEIHGMSQRGVADDFGHGDDTVAAYAAKYDVFFHCCSIFSLLRYDVISL